MHLGGEGGDEGGGQGGQGAWGVRLVIFWSMVVIIGVDQHFNLDPRIQIVYDIWKLCMNCDYLAVELRVFVQGGQGRVGLGLQGLNWQLTSARCCLFNKAVALPGRIGQFWITRGGTMWDGQFQDGWRDLTWWHRGIAGQRRRQGCCCDQGWAARRSWAVGLALSSRSPDQCFNYLTVTG